jgi:hypothetical protein
MRKENTAIRLQLMQLAKAIGEGNYRLQESFSHFIPIQTEAGITEYYCGDHSLVIKTSNNGHDFYALKIPVLNPELVVEKYQFFSQVMQHQPQSFFPHTAVSEEGIVITTENGEQTLPVILTPWKQGIPLRNKIEALCEAEDTGALKRIYASFLLLADDLLNHDNTHGDICDTNILVDITGRLKLVDFDNAYTAEMNDLQQPGISNHYYQHPEHEEFAYSRQIDDFPLLVMAISLYVISIRPDLYDSYKTEKGLIFTPNDFVQPERSVVMQYLQTINDSYLQNLLRQLQITLFSHDVAVPGLLDILITDAAFDDQLSAELKQKLTDATIEDKDETIFILNTKFRSLVTKTCDNDLEIMSLEKSHEQLTEAYRSDKEKMKSRWVATSLLLLFLAAGFFSLQFKKNTGAGIAHQQPIPEQQIGSVLLAEQEKADVVTPEPKKEIKPTPAPEIKTVQTPKKEKRTYAIGNVRSKQDKEIEKKSNTFNVVFKEIEFNR